MVYDRMIPGGIMLSHIWPPGWRGGRLHGVLRRQARARDRVADDAVHGRQTLSRNTRMRPRVCPHPPPASACRAQRGRRPWFSVLWNRMGSTGRDRAAASCRFRRRRGRPLALRTRRRFLRHARDAPVPRLTNRSRNCSLLRRLHRRGYPSLPAYRFPPPPREFDRRVG